MKLFSCMFIKCCQGMSPVRIGYTIPWASLLRAERNKDGGGEEAGGNREGEGSFRKGLFYEGPRH